MASTFETLFGSTLLSAEGKVDTAAALKDKKAVAIYFSAHWCPPCRGFTPRLAEAYTKSLRAKGLEIVFVSSDRDEAAFASYFKEQPWLALPHAERKTKDALSGRFGVSGIPTLVILDGATGKVITKNGRAKVMEDPTGQQFPWTPPSIWEVLGSEFLRGTEGDSTDIDEVRSNADVIGVYFSAHWCPPCRGFTPKLVEAYAALQAAGKRLEVIFVSSDRSSAEFRDYFQTMPWLAIDPADKRKAALSQHFDVNGIPTLVLLDAATGAVLTNDGRSVVMGDPKGKRFPWGATRTSAATAPAPASSNAAKPKIGEPERRVSFFGRLFRRHSREGAPAA